MGVESRQRPLQVSELAAPSLVPYGKGGEWERSWRALAVPANVPNKGEGNVAEPEPPRKRGTGMQVGDADQMSPAGEGAQREDGMVGVIPGDVGDFANNVAGFAVSIVKAHNHANMDRHGWGVDEVPGDDLYQAVILVALHIGDKDGVDGAVSQERAQ